MILQETGSPSSPVRKLCRCTEGPSQHVGTDVLVHARPVLKWFNHRGHRGAQRAESTRRHGRPRPCAACSQLVQPQGAQRSTEGPSQHIGTDVLVRARPVLNWFNHGGHRGAQRAESTRRHGRPRPCGLFSTSSTTGSTEVPSQHVDTDVLVRARFVPKLRHSRGIFQRPRLRATGRAR